MDAALDAAESGSAGLLLAGWLQRAGAALVDAVLVAVVSYVLIWVLHLYTTQHPHGTSKEIIDAWPSGVVWFLYAAVLECRPGRHAGQTIGKQALDIKVVRRDGSNPGRVAIVVREGVGRGLPIALSWTTPVLAALAAVYLVVDCLWPLWDRENRTLHDRLARSRVVRAD